MTDRKYPVVRNKYLRCYMAVQDVIGSLVTALIGRRARVNVPVRRVLLRNPAALGDTLYTLRLANAIRRANPDIEIGVLVARASVALVRESADIDYIHVEEHYLVSRAPGSRLRKLYRYLRAWPRLAHELRAMNYDVAIDCYYYFPSAAGLLWQAGIPVRVGYDSHEGAPLYTQAVHFELADIHNVEYQAQLVRAAGIAMGRLADTELPFRTPPELPPDVSAYRDYIVVSVGTGAPNREWREDNWHAVLAHLDTLGRQIVIVGAGSRERERIARLLSRGYTHTVSLCDRLSLPQLFLVIKNARLFIGLESFAGHIAGMYHVPQVSIMHGGTNQYHWQPYAAPDCTVVRRYDLPCLGCYFPRCCPRGNACIEIDPAAVIAAIDERLLATHEVRK